MFRIIKDAGNVLFMGEFGQDTAGIRLGKARTLIFGKGPNSQQTIQIGMIIGSPERVYFPLGVVSWDVTDENLIKVYREAVSGLVLPPGGEGKVLTPRFAS